MTIPTSIETRQRQWSIIAEGICHTLGDISLVHVQAGERSESLDDARDIVLAMLCHTCNNRRELSELERTYSTDRTAIQSALQRVSACMQSVEITAFKSKVLLIALALDINIRLLHATALEFEHTEH